MIQLYRYERGTTNRSTSITYCRFYASFIVSVLTLPCTRTPYLVLVPVQINHISKKYRKVLYFVRRTKFALQEPLPVEATGSVYRTALVPLVPISFIHFAQYKTCSRTYLDICNNNDRKVHHTLKNENYHGKFSNES